MSNEHSLAPDCEHCNGTGRGAGGAAYLADCEHCGGTGKEPRDPAIVERARTLTKSILDKAARAKAENDETLQNTGRDDADPHVVSCREAVITALEGHGFDLADTTRDILSTRDGFVVILPNETPEEKRAEVEHDVNAIMPEGVRVFVQRRGGGQSAHVTTTPLSPGVIPTASASPPKLIDDPLRADAIAEIKTVLPVLTKHEAQAVLAKCDRGSQHCSECPAFGCCDNTAIRVREPDDALVAMRERECVGVPVVFRDPITGETSEGERGPVCERVSVFCSCGQHNTHGGDRCLRCGQRIDEPGPSPDDLPRARATEPDDCRPCGGTGREGGYSARDDCPACGGTGKARRVDVTATLTHESGGMVPPRPTTPIAVCPLQPGLGSNLDVLLPKTDARKILEAVIRNAQRSSDEPAYVAWLVRLRDRLDGAEQDAAAYRYSAAYWWTQYHRALGKPVPQATDREVRALVPGVQDGAAWREAIEWALGVEPDPEEHTTEWAKELVRAVREIGNKAHVEAETMRRVAREVFDPTKPARLVNLDSEPDPRYCGDCGALSFRTFGAHCEGYDVLLPKVHERNDGFDVERCDECVKARAGIDPAAPTHDEQGNPLSLGFLRCHFPASDKGDVMKLAASVGVGPDEKTKRTLSDMTPEELRAEATRKLCPRSPTRRDLEAALAECGCEVVEFHDSGDGRIVVRVSGVDPEALPELEHELQSTLMPVTTRLVLVHSPAHPYR